VAPGNRWIWNAWQSLHDERPYIVQGMSSPMGVTIIQSRPGNIPWSRLHLWAQHHGMSPAELHLLHTVVRKMDAAFREDWERKHKVQR
jgi:hypothetical protein